MESTASCTFPVQTGGIFYPPPWPSGRPKGVGHLDHV